MESSKTVVFSLQVVGLVLDHCRVSLCFLNSCSNRLTLFVLSGLDSLQRKLPSPGFQVEVVLVDVPTTPNTETTTKRSDESSGANPVSVDGGDAAPKQSKNSGNQDDVFSDGETDEGSSKSRRAEAASAAGGAVINSTSTSETNSKSDQIASLTQATEQASIGNKGSTQVHAASEPKSVPVGGSAPSLSGTNSESEFKAMAADASVFTFGDDEDYESE